MSAPRSIFERYYGDTRLQDRYVSDPERAVDVIIPLLTVNEAFPANLCSYYREIPIRRLLIGDGGCAASTLEMLRAFPRVELIPQRENKTLGYCLRQLIEKVESEWFVYLHADVYLPGGWFDAMARHQADYDWFECNRRMSVLVDYPQERQNAAERPYSGSQMGRKKAFETFLGEIEDDYLYRNEDLILRARVEKAGGRYGRVAGTFHHHQTTNRPQLEPSDVTGVEIAWRREDDWYRKMYDMQVRGLIKYTEPDQDYLVDNLRACLKRRIDYGSFDKGEFLRWTAERNARWLPHVKAVFRTASGRRGMVLRELSNIAQSLKRIARGLLP